MTRRILPSAAALTALCLVWLTPAVHAQGTWDAMLTIQAFPSPYYSDWDANPNIGSLTVMNHTASAEDVRIFFTITDRMNRVIAQGNSEPETIAAGAVAIYDSPYEIAGSGTHDAEIERIASRTGRLPEGDYTACASAADASGFVLAEACADFFIAYPDPPLLLAPDPAAVVTEEAPLFQWTPVPVPTEYQLTYALRVVEVLEGQLPGEALAANIPVHEERDAFSTTYRYPIDARPLEPGRTYAWSVRALDQNGYAASANEGRSEIWTFAVEDPSGPLTPTGALTLTLRNSADPESAAAEKLRLSDICQKAWGTASGAIMLDMDVDPAFLPGTAEFAVELYIDYTSLDWALVTADSTRSHQWLLYGRCDVGGPLGGLQWIARKATSFDDLNMPVAGAGDAAADTVAAAPVAPQELGWRFGVLILSLYPMTAGKDLAAQFSGVAEFLGFREISVLPGVNLYAELSLADSGPVWDVLTALGHTDPHIALQGFVGLSREFSVGGQIGRTVGDTASTSVGAGGKVEATILQLRASLPRRPPMFFEEFIESTQASVQLVGKGEVELGWKSAPAGWQRDGQASVKLSLSMSLAMLFSRSGIERTATVGFVKAVDGDTTTGFWNNAAVLIKMDSDREWAPFERVPTLTLNSPEMELKIGLADLRERIRQRTILQALTGKLAGQFGLGEFQDLGKFELQLSGTGALPAAQTRPRSGAIDDGSDPGAGRPRSNATADESNRPDFDEPDPTPPAPGTTLKWQAGLSLGNMSLTEAMRFLSVLVTAVAQ